MRIGSLLGEKPMSLEKLAKEQFKKLSKKQQKEFNASKRIPTCRASVIMESSKYSKKDRHAWKASGTAYLG